MKYSVCNVCNEPIKLGRMGYVHQNGGMYMQYCPDCGWTGETEGSYKACPSCGQSTNLRDDHVVHPLKRT